jgi:molybdate transport system substrate-binding protein
VRFFSGCHVAAVAWLAATTAAAQTLSVAAASDLQAALPAIAARFETHSGQKVALTFGSSGNFFTQIQNGAPFDVLLSADVEYPRELERSGHAERGSLYTYAAGHIVLWTRTDSGIDVRPGLAVVASPKVRRIAIANPAHAPYGRAAVAALRHEHLYEQVEDKLVRGENISQAAQFVQSGNADVGIVALSLALAPGMNGGGTFVEIPESFYSPIDQAAIVVAASKQKASAHEFVRFLTTAESVGILETFGFARPRAARE